MMRARCRIPISSWRLANLSFSTIQQFILTASRNRLTGQGWRAEDKKIQAISSSHAVKKKKNKSNHAEVAGKDYSERAKLLYFSNLLLIFCFIRMLSARECELDN